MSNIELKTRNSHRSLSLKCGSVAYVSESWNILIQASNDEKHLKLVARGEWRKIYGTVKRKKKRRLRM